MNKVYLGDGVYANYDGYMLTLTTEDGIRVTNTIHLEPGIFSALTDYAKRVYEWRAEETEKQTAEVPESSGIARVPDSAIIPLSWKRCASCSRTWLPGELEPTGDSCKHDWEKRP